MSSRRSNQEWLADLRGLNGPEAQSLAIQELGSYLYVVLYNYLRIRQADVPLLAEWDTTSLSMEAEDLVQDVLIKMLQDNCALLDKFSNKGAFTLWAAAVARNHTAEILRKAPYKYGQKAVEDDVSIVDLIPEKAIRQEEIIDALVSCVERLNENRRYVFIERVLKYRPTKAIIIEIGTTINAVDQLVMHAKRDMKACMECKGFGPEDIDLF